MTTSKDDLRRECEMLRAELVQKTHVIEVFKAELEKTNDVLGELKTRLQNDYKALASLFRFIVPTKIPQISGFQFSTQYKPGSEINGDYFDIFEHKDKLKFGTLMSRSGSPGASAVVLALILKMARELDHMQTQNPDLILQHLIDEMQKDLTVAPDLFLGYFDKRTYLYSYAFSGNLYAVASMQKNTKSINLIDNKATLKTHEMKLEGGDKVVLISEGFFKIPNKEGQFLAHEDVTSVLASLSLESTVHDVRHEILFLFDNHLKEAKQTQDITLLVFSPDEPVLRLA